MRRLAWILALLPGLTGAAFGQDADTKPPSKARIDAWVSQLGDRSWAKREEASRRLARAGKAALTALERAAASRDLEVATRARKVLDAIRAAGALVRRDFAELYPARTLFYVSSPDGLRLQKRIRAGPLHRIWKDPSVARLYAKWREGLIDADILLWKGLDPVFRGLTGKLSLGVVMREKEPLKAPPLIYALADTAGSDALIRDMHAMLRAVDMRVGPFEHRGLEGMVSDEEDLTVVGSGGQVLLTGDFDSEGATFADVAKFVLDGPSKPLSRDKGYAALLQWAKGADVMARYRFTKDFVLESAGDKDLVAALRGIGLRPGATVFASDTFGAAGVVERIRLELPKQAKPTGLLGALRSGPITGKTWPLIPPRAEGFVTVAPGALAARFDAFRKALKVMDPFAEKVLRESLREMRRGGLDIKREIFDQIAGEVTLCLWLERKALHAAAVAAGIEPQPLLQMVAFCRVKRPAAMDVTCRHAISAASADYDKEVRAVKLGDGRMYTIPEDMAEDLEGQDVSVAVTGGHVIFGTTSQGVRDLAARLRGGGGKGLVATPRCAAALKAVRKDAGVVAYWDPWAAFPLWLPAIDNMLFLMLDFEPGDFPPPKALARHLGPFTAALRSDGTGMEVETTGPTGLLASYLIFPLLQPRP